MSATSVLCFLTFAPEGSAQAYTPDETLLVLGVRVELGDGNVDNQWSSLQGGELVTEIPDASVMDFREPSAGHKYVGELTLSGPLTSGRFAYTDWLNSLTLGGRGERSKTITATEVLQDGVDGPTLSYLDAFPTRYVFPELSASGTGNLTETLVVKPNRIERGGGSRGGANAGSYEILENGAGKFSVEIEGSPSASTRVVGVSIEDLVIDTYEMTTGADWDYRVYGPGDAHFGDMTLTVARDRDSQEIYQWWLDNSRGSTVRKTIKISVLKRDRSVARSYTFYDCFPVSYKSGNFSPTSNLATLEVVVTVGRVEFN